MSLPPLSQYADDTSVVVRSNAAITATFEVYDLYERGSGAKLNLSKYKGYGSVLATVGQMRLWSLSGVQLRLEFLVFFWPHLPLRRIIGAHV